jgi:hypothetical protein
VFPSARRGLRGEIANQPIDSFQVKPRLPGAYPTPSGKLRDVTAESKHRADIGLFYASVCGPLLLHHLHHHRFKAQIGTREMSARLHYFTLKLQGRHRLSLVPSSTAIETILVTRACEFSPLGFRSVGELSRLAYPWYVP